MIKDSKKINVLYFLEQDSKYGASQSAKIMITELVKSEKVRAHVAVPYRFDDYDYYKKIGCEVIRLPYTYCVIEKNKNIFMWAIKFIVRGIEYFVGNVLTILIVPHKINMRDIDLIHCNSSRLDIAALVADRTKKNLIWHVREFGKGDFNRYYYRRNYINFMNQKGSLFIMVSESIRKEWISRGLSESKCIRVYNGVCQNQLEKTRRHDKNYKIIMAGGITKAKGQWQAIEALNILRNNNLYLDFWGDGKKEYIDKLKNRVKECSLENNVRFCGYTNELSKILKDYDCGLMCSDFEAFGRVTAEYMMAGLVVVVSDSGANMELIEDLKSGIVYKAKDVENLAIKIQNILDMSTDNRNSISECAKERARNLFLAQTNAANIYQIYTSL